MAEIFQLIPHQQIGPVALGMLKDDLRRTLRGNVIATAAYVDEELDNLHVFASDYFEESGIKVEYNEKNEVVFIEVGNLFPVYYDSHSLFEMRFNQLYNLFRQRDALVEMDESGFTSFELCVSVYAPEHVESKNCLIELVSIFSEGYLESGG